MFKLKDSIVGLFAIDSLSYVVISTVLAVALLWGLAEFFVWLYSVIPWWVKFIFACLFAYALFKQMRKDQIEQKFIEQETPTEIEQ